jgi:hypothetical protein
MIITLNQIAGSWLVLSGIQPGVNGMNGFAIFRSIDIYDNRDAIVGSRIEQVSEYVYETEALAHRFVPSTDYDYEYDFYVARTSNPHKRLRRAVADVYADDIPF